MTTATRNATLVWAAAAALLCVPAIAMQFTREINWTASDFVVFGAMLAMALGGYELLSRRSGETCYRLGAAVAISAGFFLMWVNLAVGIIGSENNDANWMFAGVLAVAIGGGIVTRFQPAGMVRTMLATAAAQVAVAGIALTFRLGTEGVAWPNDVIGVTGVLTAIWLASAALFRRAR